MSNADQKFAAAARDWLNAVADEQEAEGRMLAARDAAEACRCKRMELEKILGECIGAGGRARGWPMYLARHAKPIPAIAREMREATD